MEVKTVGIIGYGSFGSLVDTLLGRFAPQIEVKIFAREKKPDNERFFSLKQAAQCDAVVLAIPIRAFEEVLKRVVPLVRKDTVVIDVATVKMHTISLLKKHAGKKKWLAAHPVWGPESYEKRGGDVSGFRIVMCDGTLDVPDYVALTDLLKRIGFDVGEISAATHDKHIAETLFLTHFIAQIATRVGLKRTTMDTVSFGWLMNAVETAEHDRELFKDVYRYNPYCKEVLKRFDVGESEVQKFLEHASMSNVGPHLRIGVAGAKGSFSEEAAREYARKAKLRKFELQYLVSVENVLSSLESGTIQLGIFPIENSTGGVVTESVEAMAKHNFKIRSMFDIDIRQNLMVRRGMDRKRVKLITSHQQALRQCKAYLKNNWRGVKIREYEDTAKAAEDLAHGKLPKTTAVIAPLAAARIYKLKVLEKSIQDLKKNLTTFIAAVK